MRGISLGWIRYRVQIVLELLVLCPPPLRFSGYATVGLQGGLAAEQQNGEMSKFLEVKMA